MGSTGIKMNYILFDGDTRTSLLPFTYTRPVADIRVGILTIREKWEKYLGLPITTITEEYLEEKYPMIEMEENIMLNASFLPTPELINRIQNLKVYQAIFKGKDVIAFHFSVNQEKVNFENYNQIEFEEDIIQINNTWDIFSNNGKAIRQDFELLTGGRESQPIPDTVQYTGKEDIFIEEDSKLTFATLNATTGPIYIGKAAEIMEGVVVRGPLAMCEKAVLKLGAKIYGPTTLGPHCKVGGEVNNSVFFGYSNKGHDGFLGNSVLGEWCNLGAGTNNSNLKNNYSEVELWNYKVDRLTKTGLQFCGLMMGDHSKCSINTMFNTGTVIGVSSNIFGSGFPGNFVPSFSWGGFSEYKLNKANEVARIVMKRRNEVYDELESKIMAAVFEQTKQYRNY